MPEYTWIGGLSDIIRHRVVSRLFFLSFFLSFFWKWISLLRSRTIGSNNLLDTTWRGSTNGSSPSRRSHPIAAKIWATLLHERNLNSMLALLCSFHYCIYPTQQTHLSTRMKTIPYLNISITTVIVDQRFIATAKTIRTNSERGSYKSCPAAAQYKTSVTYRTKSTRR